MTRRAWAVRLTLGAMLSWGVVIACSSEDAAPVTGDGDASSGGSSGASGSSSGGSGDASGGQDGGADDSGDGAPLTCEQTCNPPSATGTCEGGTCAIAKCASHRLDCDDAAANGCEIADNTSLTNCGGCNQICEDCVIAQLDELVKRTIVSAPVKADCATEPKICCAGGDAGTCNPLTLDFTLVNGDLPRLVTTKQGGASRVDMTLRVRVSGMFPFSASGLDCVATVASTNGGSADFKIDVQWVTETVDAGAAVQTSPVNFTLTQVDGLDFTISGGTACVVFGFTGQDMTEALTKILRPALVNEVCDGCPCPQ